MDQWTGLMALATQRQVIGARLKSQCNLFGTAAMNRNVITWPERGKINMMHSDSRVREPVCLATTSLPDPCLSTYLSPRFREEPFKKPVRLAVLVIKSGEKNCESWCFKEIIGIGFMVDEKWFGDDYLIINEAIFLSEITSYRLRSCL